MIKQRIQFFTVLVTCILTIFGGCSDGNQNSDEDIRNLESNVKILEDGGKIRTFPLTIIIADQLSGELLPENLRRLCMISKYNCKTLPLAGILRLGSNNYYEYNSIPTLDLPASLRNSEADLTDTVERQVNKYLLKTKLESYDSLLKPNNAGWNMEDLSLDYIKNSADSIFFFSDNATSSGTIQLYNRSFLLFNNITELRRKIDEIICRNPKSISVFYTPPPFDTSRVTFTKSKVPAKGTPAGDSCVGYAKYEKLHDGRGGFITGGILELQSEGCGFKYPTGLAGDTCINNAKFQKLHNGKGGFLVGKIIDRNSKDCGFVYPTGVAGDSCIKGSLYQKLHNGKGGFSVGNLLETNSKSCGMVYPTGVAGDTCKGGSKYQKLHNGKGGFSLGRLLERNSISCGFSFPAAGTLAPGYICENGSKYAKMNNGKGGFVRGALIEANSRQCMVKGPDNTCATKSDAICEKDNAGNYTGRRVQLCYNKAGAVIRTIVISRCDGDCRCLGN